MMRSGSVDGSIGDSLKESPARGLLKLLETDLARKDRATKLFHFFFPWFLFVSISIALITAVTTMYDWNTGRELLNVWIFYTLPPAGKETLIPKAVSSGVPGMAVGLSTSAVDICVSLFLIWNYDWVKKLPIIGPALERTEEKGRRKVQRTNWFRRATFILTTFVVFVPFSGSGGVGGTVFGRIVGLNPYLVLLAVAIGSSIGSTGFAVLSETLTDFLGSDNFMVSFLSNLNILQFIAILVAMGFLLYTIRNPRMAAVKTTKAVSDALDFTEKTLDKAEERRRWVSDMALKGTRESLKLMGEGNRALSNFGLEVATKPLDFMGEKGRRFRSRSKEYSIRQLDRVQRIAEGTIERTMNAGFNTSKRSIDFATELTRDGIRETRAGWNEAGKYLVIGGERIERIYPRGKNGFRNGINDEESNPENPEEKTS